MTVNAARSASVNQLLSLGEVKTGEAWRDYKALGLAPADIPDLIALATDLVLNDADTETAEVWAPLHAWRALAQLRAAAAEPLIALLYQLSEDDWIYSDFPLIMEQLGPPALPALTTAIATHIRDQDSIEIMLLVNAVARISKKFPETRHQGIALCTRYLENATLQDSSTNGTLVESLLELRAKKALPLIAAAFAHDLVDEMFVSWETVLETFQLPADLNPEDV